MRKPTPLIPKLVNQHKRLAMGMSVPGVGKPKGSDKK